MSVSAEQAAWCLCEAADWKLTQLSVHKGLYLAHMTHLGKHGEPLISERFQAWDYGPVVPSLYSSLKMFGRRPVKDIFWVDPIDPDGSAANIIKSIAKQIRDIPAGALVHFTHDPKGAWAKNYQPGVRGIEIPNQDILEEYHWRPKKK